MSSRPYDYLFDRDYDGPGPRPGDADEFLDEGPMLVRCYMCVSVEHRMDEEAAKAVGHEWPLREVVKETLVNRSDPTVMLKLSCGHSII